MLDPHQHLFGRIPRLGIPSSLIDYLLFNVSLDDDDDDGIDSEDEIYPPYYDSEDEEETGG